MKTRKGPSRDLAQKPSPIGLAAKRGTGVAEKWDHNLEREHLKGVTRVLAARSDALDAAMDYMEAEGATTIAATMKKAANPRRDPGSISQEISHSDEEEDTRFREAEKNYFRRSSSFSSREIPCYFHAVMMLFCVLQDAGFALDRPRIAADVDEYDLETVVLTLARVFTVLRKRVRCSDDVSAPPVAGGLVPPRRGTENSLRASTVEEQRVPSSVPGRKTPPAPRRGKSDTPPIAQTHSSRGPRAKPLEPQDLVSEQSHIDEGLLSCYAAGSGGAGGRVAAVSTATRLRASAVSEVTEFSGKEHDEEAARTWLNKVQTAFRQDQMQPEEVCLIFADLMIGPARNCLHVALRVCGSKDAAFYP
ncbi:hypothetical protein ON010_g6718 [Phytophthora cinnamomi]|nr:hypothetical protein ON010_g6718 [Phytophthora cinnamomi]